MSIKYELLEKLVVAAGLKNVGSVPRLKNSWPVFTFLKEGRDGEREIIDDITHFYAERGASV